MNPTYLIDSIVRQTTVLIAQLSTAAGIRAPLSHIADQVFVELAREIESQGVGRKVAADMFGMALRTYQTRLQRLTEVSSQRDRTLWTAVLDYITREGTPLRSRIEQRFDHDGARAVAAVLHDLVSSGLISCTGKGSTAVYRVTSDTERKAVGAAADVESLCNLVWVELYRGGPLGLTELQALWPSANKILPDVLSRLQGESRIVPVERSDVGGEPQYRATEIAIPVGSEQGWEGAVLDHFRAMSTAIAHKLSFLSLVDDTSAKVQEQVGGATLTFDIHDKHPLRDEVLTLLPRVRAEVNELWQRVKTTNESSEVPEDASRIRVTFYFGQNREERDA